MALALKLISPRAALSSACRLFFANRHQEDVILADELTRLDQDHREVEIQLVLTGGSAAGLEAPRGEDRKLQGLLERAIYAKLEGDTLTELIPKPTPSTFTLVCGPPGFHLAVRAALGAAGHPQSAVHEFK